MSSRTTSRARRDDPGGSGETTRRRLRRSGRALRRRQVRQIRATALFGVFVGWALAVRRTDLETHKRMIGLAILAPFVLATHLLWDLPAWQALAPRIVGVQGW